MKNFILIILIALFTSACVPSSLKMNANNELVLEHNSKSYTFPGTIIDSNSLSFQKIEVEQRTLKEANGEKFFYEQIIVDTDYEFEYGSITTLKYIFDVSRTNIIYKDSNILLIQLRVKDDKYINLMAETSSMQDMAYIYGFSNKKLLKIANELNADKYEIKNSFDLEKPLAEWSQKKLILQPLVKPMFRRGRF